MYRDYLSSWKSLSNALLSCRFFLPAAAAVNLLTMIPTVASLVASSIHRQEQAKVRHDPSAETLVRPGGAATERLAIIRMLPAKVH